MIRSNLFKLIFLTFLLGIFNISKSQGLFEEDGYDKMDKKENDFFSNDPVFENRKSVGRRGDINQGFDEGMTYGGSIPVDGGITLMVGGLIGYGVNRIRKRGKNENPQ